MHDRFIGTGIRKELEKEGTSRLRPSFERDIITPIRMASSTTRVPRHQI